jgi:hypothetical protein
MNSLLALRTAASTAIERHIARCHQSITGHHSLPLGSFCGIRQQLRFKHSSRQKKRMANHPARLRVQDRLQSAEPTRSPKPKPTELPPPTSAYAKVFEPELLMNGWSAPPAEQSSLIQKYPFQIPRTRNKPNDVAGFLPVYTYFR